MKNKFLIIFLSLILVVAFVSAGITGKVVSLKESSSESVSLDDSNYDVAVQSVTDGIVTVQVTNQQTGQTESVAIGKGENTVTSTGVEVKIEDVRKPFLGRPRADVRISSSDTALQPDFPTPSSCTDSDGGLNYFVKGTVTTVNGTNNVTNTDYCTTSNSLKEFSCTATQTIFCSELGKSYMCSNGACVSNATNAINTTHTHLSDYKWISQPLTILQTPNYNQIYGEANCGSGYVVLGGGFSLNNAPRTGGYTIRSDGPVSENGHYVAIDDQSKTIGSGVVYATCAKREPTLHLFGQDK